MKGRSATLLRASFAGSVVLASGLLMVSSPAAFAATAAPAPGGAATAATSSGSPNPWTAASGLPAAAARQLQAAIDAQIGAHGGTQISPYEVAYNGGAVVMVFANPLTGALPTSAADRVETRQRSTPGRPGAAAVSPLTTSYRYGCPYTGTTGWTCFYQNIDFNHNSCSGSGSCGDGGRMLEFSTCGTQDLSTYGFSDQTTSWVNNTSSYVTVYDVNNSLLWSESPGSSSSYVGSADNDRADNFWLIC